MNFDLDKYLPFLDEIDLPLSQKEEMLRTVWGMMESQVDQAFGVHPVQSCMKTKKTLPKTSVLDLESINTATVSAFNKVAANEQTYNRKVVR